RFSLGFLGYLSVRNDVGKWASATSERRRPTVRQRMSQADNAYESESGGNLQACPDRLVGVRWHPEEARGQALVYGAEQDQQARHAGVDVPVRNRPARWIPVGPALVRLRVAIEVGVPVGQGHDQDRRRLHPPQPTVHRFVSGGCGPKSIAVLVLVEHQKMPALAETGRR